MYKFLGEETAFVNFSYLNVKNSLVIKDLISHYTVFAKFIVFKVMPLKLYLIIIIDHTLAVHTVITTVHNHY